MKNLFLLATSIFFFCCTSQEITEVENETDSDRMILEKNPVLNLSEDLASESLVKLVRLINKDGSQYVFNTSKNEALQLGAIVNEFEDVKDAVKFMNVKLGMAESERSTNLARSMLIHGQIEFLLKVRG